MNEAAGKSICPVCEEDLDPSAPKCFRCTTALTDWWPLDEALRKGLPGTVPVPEPETSTSRMVWPLLVMFLVVGGLLGFAVGNSWRGGTADYPVVEVAPPLPPDMPAGSRSDTEPEEPKVVLYTVQSGDSLWRVAASLTGDGQNWLRLWPEYESSATRLQRGTDLEIPLAALRAPTRRGIEAER